jgi:hypothetical protein
MYADHSSSYATYQQLSPIAKSFTTSIVHSCSSEFEKILDVFEEIVKDLIDIASFLCRYVPKLMEGTALTGEEEAEPFEAIVEADCKIFEGALDIFDLAKNTITSVDDAVSCAEVKASTHSFAVYTAQTWG